MLESRGSGNRNRLISHGPGRDRQNYPLRTVEEGVVAQASTLSSLVRTAHVLACRWNHGWGGTRRQETGTGATNHEDRGTRSNGWGRGRWGANGGPAWVVGTSAMARASIIYSKSEQILAYWETGKAAAEAGDGTSSQERARRRLNNAPGRREPASAFSGLLGSVQE